MGREIEARIARKIEAEGGWISFEDFMAEALYAPGLGYYSSGRQTFGLGPRNGSDFVTAPELSPLFGKALARQVHQALKACSVNKVVEFGAGTGALAEQLLEALLETDLGAGLTYDIVDVSGTLRARQQERLARFSPRVRWLDALPAQLDAVLIGNEVLDAMPVQLLHFDGSAWHERGVVLGDAGQFAWGDRPTQLRPPLDLPTWVPDTVTEIHHQALAWLRSLATRLQRGALFLIDYGFTEAEYYHPQRVSGTLMCHFRHQSDAEPLVNVGEKDITAHVNFSALALCAQDAGWETLGYTSQANFLLNCGISDFLQSCALPERAMAQKLLTEHEMGELFKVIGFSTPQCTFDALGFSRGDRSHRL